MRFVVLADTERAAGLAEMAALGLGADAQVVTHASGRPWILGDWRSDEAVIVSAGTRRLALFGNTRVSVPALSGQLARAGTPADLDRVFRPLRGSPHLLASFDGRTRSQGALSTARQIFYTTVDGLTVGGSSQRILAGLAGTGPRTEALAMRLLFPGAPWPLQQDAFWAGVETLPAGSWLDVRDDGSHRVHRWWSPPDATLSLRPGAEGVRAALVGAVEARPHGTAISADLSGGLDSSTLCFLAASTGAALVTHHLLPLDPANDDARWARWVAGQLPRAEHRYRSPDDGPAWFEHPDVIDAAALTDGPMAWHRNRVQLAHTARAMAAEGSRLHLTGVGGDELFSAGPVVLWSRWRENPRRAFSAVRRARVMNRWRWRDLAPALVDNGPFDAWLARAADGLTAPPLRTAGLGMNWGGELRMPRWSTAGATDAVRELILATAGRGVEPLHPHRAQHQLLDAVLATGGALREANTALSPTGVRWEAPFLDDQVVEAALRVSVGERGMRGRYKPVLAAAVRGLVPDRLVERRSKGEFSAEAESGLRRSRRMLVDWCDDLHLTRLGLVNADALRSALLGSHPHRHDLMPFESTIACESWLRLNSAGAPAGRSTTGGRR
ncbi:asparagine synthase-related protein [Actinoplanes sp. NPDC089786]|uniref:asparagine synthase-related protein n=1 Tax=Actinoplanes sp. NPDC089786 TaxID=3155185 RepID=UPI00343AC582